MTNVKSMFSIIIPVYQAKNYLKKCVESILNQTYKNAEIILVDDGSDDGSSRLCDEYAQNYSNIYCIHQENKGVSAARNTGLNSAGGEYILFVDSDDYIEADYLENAMTVFLNASDIYLCGFQDIKKDGIVTEKKYYPAIQEGEWLRSDIGNVIMSLFKTATLHAIGTKIYKKSIIEQYGIRFKEKWNYYEDIYFCLNYLYYCNKIYVQNKIMYYYRKDVSNSLSRQKKNLHYKNIRNTYILVSKFIKFNGENSKNERLFYEMYLEGINACINFKIEAENHYTINMHRLYKALSKDIFYQNALADAKTGKADLFCLNRSMYFMAYIIHKFTFYSQIEI